MEAVDLIRGRRSVRRFKKEKVDRALLQEIVELSRWSPSWGNFQVARYTIVDNDEVIAKLSTDGVNGFIYNINTLKEANGVCVLSFVKGKSGMLETGDYVTSEASVWEVFDAGIACQNFCLSAYEKGIGTCVMGVINVVSISEIVGLPEEETVAALIVFGHPIEIPSPTPRKDVDAVMRFV